MRTETIESIATVGNRTTEGGAAVGFLGWLLSSQAIGLIGLLVAALGLFVTWYYRREADRRHMAEYLARQQERQMRMDLMRATGKPIAPPYETDLASLDASE